MKWTKEERRQLGFAESRARETKSDEAEAIANAAIEIVRARGGTMATEALENALSAAEYAKAQENRHGSVSRLRQHTAAQGARISLLEEELRANREEIARQISGENVRIGNAVHEAWAHHYKERDALKAECDRLRESIDIHRKDTDEWRDRAFRQSRETIQKGIEAAQAKKEQQRVEKCAQGYWNTIIDQEEDIRDLKTQLQSARDLVEAYRKAGMLEHERAEAGEKMIAAMRRDRIGSFLDW